MYSLLRNQLHYIRSVTDFEPEIALVLGSGLGDFAKQIDVIAEIPYCDIPQMPVSTAPSHKGSFLFGTLGDKKIVAMQGRIHLYEGYSPQQVVMPIRLMYLLGARTLILTNAAGGINKHFVPGDFMLITDHISCFVSSPLIGKNENEIGIRFPNMSSVYCKDLQKKALQTAEKCGISLLKGIYVQLTGPQFETPAEIEMLSTLGADAVGMSTVIEAVAAVHCGFKVCGISVITNLASGITDKPQTEEEVVATADAVAHSFEALIKGIISA